MPKHLDISKELYETFTRGSNALALLKGVGIISEFQAAGDRPKERFRPRELPKLTAMVAVQGNVAELPEVFYKHAGDLKTCKRRRPRGTGEGTAVRAAGTV